MKDTEETIAGSDDDFGFSEDEDEDRGSDSEDLKYMQWMNYVNTTAVNCKPAHSCSIVVLSLFGAQARCKRCVHIRNKYIMALCIIRMYIECLVPRLISQFFVLLHLYVLNGTIVVHSSSENITWTRDGFPPPLPWSS